MSIDTQLQVPAQAELAPTQLLVLGRGMEDDSTIGPLTLENALAAVRFCVQNESVQRVVFSGNGTNGESPSGTEAVAMARSADLPLDISVGVESRSRTTTENFLNSAGLLDPEAVTGVLAHRAHLPRAMWLGRRVLGKDAKLVEVAAEDYGANPETGKSARVEAINFTATRILYAGAKGFEAMQRREQRISGFKQKIRSLIGRAPGDASQY